MAFPSGKRRRWIIVGGFVVAAAIAVAIVWGQSDPLRSKARRAWRDHAITTIQRRLDDNERPASELARLRPATVTQPVQGGWVGDELLIAKNGDWILSQNVCVKEQHTAVKQDLFIGRGSDGCWYYSTFHFCVGKSVLQMERQPDSLAQFVDAYWLVPFDGKSDESPKATWAGGPYGDEKLRSALGASAAAGR